MGLMGNLRNRSGLVLIVIGLALVAFLLGEAIHSGSSLWASKQNQVGSVNGESFDYKEFNQQVEQTSQMYQQQMGGAETPQIKNFAVQQVWNKVVSENLINSEIEKIGLTVGKKELNDLVSGPNPSPQIVQNFTNPQTGQFDRSFLTNVLNEVKKGKSDIAPQWESLLESIKTQRLSEKYANIIRNSVYVTALEAQDEYTAKNKLANFKYVMLDYSSVKDSEIKLTDADYKEYYEKYKNSFKNQEETRAVEYVLVNANPSSQDTASVLATIQQLKTDLISSKNDSLFASINSDVKYPVAFLSKGQLSPALDSVVFNAAPGTTVGPFLSNGAYEIGKVIASKFSPDSVKISHILLNTAAEGGAEKAKLKADSIKGLLSKGESFSSLAIEFSQDQNSKANGGELGTFARGQIGGAIEEAAFGGKPGEVVVINSQSGTHILKIDKQIGNSKTVKVAVVNKAINAGKETTDGAYAKANNLFTEATSANFADVAKQKGLNVTKAARVQAMDNTLNGVEVPRELLRWVYDAKEGELSDKIYETENNFIIAKVVGINPKGVQPLNAIKADIELGTRNLVKARMLKEKMNNALNGATSIDQAAQKIGKSAISVENIVLANPVIPGVALESTVVGTVFGLQPNKPSKSIEGTQGVYAVQVESFVNPKEMVEAERKAQQKQLLSSKEQRSWGAIFKALQDNANIVDNRIRFY